MRIGLLLAMIVLLSQPVASAEPEPADHPDYQVVKQVLLDSIGWAMTKDLDRLLEIFADDDLLIWWVSTGGTIHGISDIKQKAETIWMTPDFTATRFDFRDIRIRFSADGTVAWFSCTFDDCGIWKGDEFCMENMRKTGVMVKRDDQWQIVQSHASWPVDAIPDTTWDRLVKQRSSDSPHG